MASSWMSLTLWPMTSTTGGGRILIDGLIDGRHQAQVHQRLDDFPRLDGHALGKIPDGDHRPALRLPGR